MKYMKKSGIYKASNVQFNPKTKEAYSYGWWKFAQVIEGKLIFNSYNYSNTTNRHQAKVKDLLNRLNIKVDMFVSFKDGLTNSDTLVDVYEKYEDYLCETFLNEEAKRDARNERAKFKRKEKKLSDYLENEIHFRDYEIRDRDSFGSYNKIAVHQVVDEIENDVQNALHSFHRDGFGCVVFYV